MSGNYEKWWSNNLFGEDEHYLHNGKKYKTPTIDEFSQEWMGTKMILIENLSENIF